MEILNVDYKFKLETKYSYFAKYSKIGKKYILVVYIFFIRRNHAVMFLRSIYESGKIC